MARVREGRERDARGGVRTETRVPLSRPYVDERDEELVLEVLRSGRLSLGPSIERFEELLAERVGAPYAAAVSSGTAGLHMLCHIAGVEPGDEVITSPVAFVATANCFIFEGGVPVFADVDPQTLNLDPAAVEAAITERTKGIVVVDMFGYPCELDELRAIAERHGLWLIDDSCEALGAEYKGRPIGSHGPSGAFGFYPNKQLTTGEGGDGHDALGGGARAAREPSQPGPLVRLALVPPRRGSGSTTGWTDIQAALGIGQLEKLDRMLEMRSEAAARYTELLAGVDGVEAPLADDADHKRSWFVYVPKLAEGIDRDSVLESLKAQGIEAGHYVPAVHLQPYMRERYGFSEGTCPVAEDACARTLALPFFPQLEAADQELVVDALRSAI